MDQRIKSLLEAREFESALQKIREFKQREMLRIAARDLARLGTLVEIVREISDVADTCLQAVLLLCQARLTERFGSPFHQDAGGRWQPSEFCVLGMGKLGGQELNYSSDIDVLFVYSEEGHLFKTPPRPSEQTGKGLGNHAFFNRLAEAVINEIGKLTADGMLFRIDLRLRPEGKSGPLTRSLGSYENFYAQWGQTWERMMLIKARGVAGSTNLGGEFLEMIQPFRFPRSPGERVLREVAAMKDRIENEVVKAGEADRNVKLGRGGIREIEFIAQALQLLHAGKIPFLQNSQTLPTLKKLAGYHLLPGDDANDLRDAYLFLRDVEHRLQMENNQQTHTIPTERKSRERLARLMGFATLADFEKVRITHTRRVRRIYESILKASVPARKNSLPESLDEHEAAWKQILSRHRFRDPEHAFQLLQIFVHGPGYGHVSPRTVELAMELLPKFLALCPGPLSPSAPPLPVVLSDPDRVLARLDSFVSVYGARGLLYETWTTNPSLFRLLLLLFDRSEFLAEAAIRTPDLVDELESSGRLRRHKTAPEILKDLHHGIEDTDQKLWIRRYHQAELMRIGLRDILGLADFEHNLTELSALADACLQYALDVLQRKNKIKSPPFCIIGLGKLGGAEINYGSDLDLMFVTDAKPAQLPPLQKVAVELLDFLSAPTELGVAFVTDARLRPDGEKGLLVNSLQAFEDYYRNRAMLWEIQSMTRVRPVAGNLKIGELFQKLAATLTNFNQPLHPPAAFTADWKKEIVRMRGRIEKERTPAGKEDLSIKTGAGGLMDAEFIAQILCLENGWQEPNTLAALQRGLASGALSKADGEKLIENYRALRRIEAILRRWSFAGETVLPDDPAPLYRVAVRCGYPTSADFMKAVGAHRAAIREVYLRVTEP